MTRQTRIERKTKETQIVVDLNIDGNGVGQIDTGIGFFDHMLNSFSRHSGIDLMVKCNGDLYVDPHHSVEDVGIVIGKALAQALGDKGGINRYGNASVPMDEALGICALDISGREYLVFDASFSGEKCGEMDTQLFEEFFRALAYNAGITLHLSAPYGINDHHKAEALFKAFARALKEATTIDPSLNGMANSTKGSL